VQDLIDGLEGLSCLTRFGRVARVEGFLVEVTGASGAIGLGGRLRIAGADNLETSCEVVGFRDGRALAMPFGQLEGITLGARATFEERVSAIYPSHAWLGRVIDAFGTTVRWQRTIGLRHATLSLRAAPPPAHARARLGGKLDLGVRALNSFLTCCKGQRMGIFSGSGVGKSILLAMLARNTAADVAVIALVGERGREVKEFIEDDLGAEGLARSVVVAATSDESPLARRQGRIRGHGDRRIFSRSGTARAAADGFCHAASPWRSARSVFPPVSHLRPKAIRQRSLPSCRACSSAPGRARGHHGQHHGTVHRLGRRRRSQRADFGCRARHPGRPHRSGRAIAERGRYPALTFCDRVARHAAVQFRSGTDLILKPAAAWRFTKTWRN
jgi:hypothetical protein